MFKRTLAILGIVLLILQIINNSIDIFRKLNNRVDGTAVQLEIKFS